MTLMESLDENLTFHGNGEEILQQCSFLIETDMNTNLFYLREFFLLRSLSLFFCRRISLDSSLMKMKMCALSQLGDETIFATSPSGDDTPFAVNLQWS